MAPFIPFTELYLSLMLYDRWYAAYEYHAQKLLDVMCDKPAQLRQREKLVQALHRAVSYGVLHSQTLAVRSDCTEGLLKAVTREYLAALGVAPETLEPVRQYLGREALMVNLKKGAWRHFASYSLN